MRVVVDERVDELVDPETMGKGAFTCSIIQFDESDNAKEP